MFKLKIESEESTTKEIAEKSDEQTHNEDSGKQNKIIVN